MYPEDSIQAVSGASDWWVQDAKHEIRRGSLIYAFVPHVDQLPYTVEPVGRRQPDQHTAAEVKIAPLVHPEPFASRIDHNKAVLSRHGFEQQKFRHRWWWLRGEPNATTFGRAVEELTGVPFRPDE